jgi:lipopolysaccharide transport system permease protein
MNMIAPGHGTAGTEVPHLMQTTGRKISISAAQSWRTRLALAGTDLYETMRLWRLVLALSFMDIKLRYRGSLLGPFWLTLSTAVMIGAMGVLYATLFHQNVAAYLPFLSFSLIFWNFLSTLTGEGGTAFTAVEGMIRAQRMPFSLHAARVVVRNLFVLAHNLVVIVVVFAIFRIVPSEAVISVIPALLLWLLDGMAACLLLGVLGARFRDIPPIVASLLQIAFYITPVLWSPTMVMHRHIGRVLVQWNPFYAMLEILRGPLLGNPLNHMAWAVALGYSALLLLLSALVFTRARARIAYWI